MVSASTTYLPLFRGILLLGCIVRFEMFAFWGLQGIENHYFPLISSNFQMQLAVRVQETSGSNPDTSTKNADCPFG